jgi:hypothetical protein
MQKPSFSNPTGGIHDFWGCWYFIFTWIIIVVCEKITFIFFIFSPVLHFYSTWLVRPLFNNLANTFLVDSEFCCEWRKKEMVEHCLWLFINAGGVYENVILFLSFLDITTLIVYPPLFTVFSSFFFFFSLKVFVGFWSFWLFSLVLFFSSKPPSFPILTYPFHFFFYQFYFILFKYSYFLSFSFFF